MLLWRCCFAADGVCEVVRAASSVEASSVFMSYHPEPEREGALIHVQQIRGDSDMNDKFIDFSKVEEEPEVKTLCVADSVVDHVSAITMTDVVISVETKEPHHV